MRYLLICVLLFSCTKLKDQASLKEANGEQELVNLCQDSKNQDLTYAIMDFIAGNRLVVRMELNETEMKYVSDLAAKPIKDLASRETGRSELIVRMESILPENRKNLTLTDCQEIAKLLTSTDYMTININKKYNARDSQSQDEIVVDLSMFKYFVNLKGLRFDKNSRIKLKNVSALASLKNLRFFHSNALQEGDLQYLPPSVSHMVARDIDVDDLTKLAHLQNLQILRWKGGRLSKLNGLEKLKKLEALQLREISSHMDYSETPTETPFDTVSQINQLSQLRALDLYSVGLNDALVSELDASKLNKLRYFRIFNARFLSDNANLDRFKDLEEFDITKIDAMY